MKYNLISVRISIIKSLQIANAGEGVEKRETFYTDDVDISWCSH